ncbi:MAG: M23 family metallopeptidase [Bacteroides sp.]|nr:M23 family metallopeptidase [Prevotella sp.]MCM1407101.1 M23 family metallopeptidase [Treponema brennaborense]MCM1470253.1 M23 family metallopeptidase [Bacteroides sp.]
MNRIFCFLIICAAAFSSAYAQENYVVQKGDTLYSIGRKYQVTVAELCEANGIADSSVLKAGQKIIIPSKENPPAPSASKDAGIPDKTESYTVQKGDTLYSIARRMGITVDILKILNQMSGNNTIKVGQILSVPQKTSEHASPPPANGGEKPALPDSSLADETQPLVDPRLYDNSKKADPNLVWPVKPIDIVYTKGKVSGVQLSAEKNTPVFAVKSGSVVFSGVYRGFGQVVFIQSKEYMYVYSGLGSISVKQGASVSYRDVIGTAGTDALSKKSNVLFMAFKNNTPVDPAKVPRG